MGCYASVASAITGGEIVETVQKKLNEYKSFSAAFEKQFYWAALNRSRSREGHLYMRRPGHFRVELDNGDAMVADGQTVWSYVERNRQVVVSSYAGELRTPWQIFVDYSDNYIPLAVEETKLSGRSSYMLVLGPANQSEVRSRKQMKVWVDKKKWWLMQIETLEDNGDITTYTLKNHKENKKIKDDVFAFEVPEGIDVIDRRVPVLGDE
jgi:outer membrane lipoprotein carrier protein